MNREEFFEKYVGYKIAVHVPTKELAYELMQEAEKHGIDFNAKDTFSHIQSEYKETLCLNFQNNTWVWSKYEYYTSKGFKIIEYKGDKRMKAREGLIAEIFEKEFDIKVDELFNVIGVGCNPFVISDHGLLLDANRIPHYAILVNILNGEQKIEKMPPNYAKITELETELREMSVRQNEIADELKKLKGGE